jgi:hypothetical protein
MHIPEFMDATAEMSQRGHEVDFACFQAMGQQQSMLCMPIST